MTTVYQGKLRGVALRDQVATVLRELCQTHLAVGPGVICSLLGSYRLIELNCCDPNCQVARHRRDFGLRQYTHEDIRPHLNRLERDGLAERHGPGRPSYYWRWIGPDAPEII